MSCRLSREREEEVSARRETEETRLETEVEASCYDGMAAIKLSVSSDHSEQIRSRYDWKLTDRYLYNQSLISDDDSLKL
jgi:hypothetical protein